jgi:ectoine hydroxylase-related dioxygenase (phytanoyl-CoA dioxygenase family)
MPTAEQIRSFEENGYLVVENVLDQDAVIEPEITSNPIQHVRIKPPATDLHGDEIRVHLDGLMPHREETQAATAEGLVDETKAVPLPVDSGGVIIFHPLTPHASLVNRTSEIRWSFDLRYNPRGQPTGRAHFPDFVARSRANPESELKSWKTWRGMWKDARARLAASPHIDIHRWQAASP